MAGNGLRQPVHAGDVAALVRQLAAGVGSGHESPVETLALGAARRYAFRLSGVRAPNRLERRNRRKAGANAGLADRTGASAGPSLRPVARRPPRPWSRASASTLWSTTLSRANSWAGIHDRSDHEAIDLRTGPGADLGLPYAHARPTSYLEMPSVPNDSKALYEQVTAVLEDDRFRAAIQRALGLSTPVPENLEFKVPEGDQMLAHSLAHHGNAAIALSQYFNIAIQQFNCFRQIAEHGFADPPEKLQVLDFACGYGRLLRFLTAWLPLGNVHGAEI